MYTCKRESFARLLIDTLCVFVVGCTFPGAALLHLD